MTYDSRQAQASIFARRLVQAATPAQLTTITLYASGSRHPATVAAFKTLLESLSGYTWYCVRLSNEEAVENLDAEIARLVAEAEVDV